MSTRRRSAGRVVVFVGPTLSGTDPGEVLDADYRPPAAQGDVLRAGLEPSTLAIGIIDGFFERVPSVWHKEILWAMAKGLHVFGGASIGALRAAELAAFGMEGVGRIYQDFVTGRLEDDDEVALVHASADDDHRPLSEPMVNVRATAAAAEAHGAISRDTHVRLVTAAKGLFYPDRVYPRIIDEAGALGADMSELAAFRRFAREAPVDQKRADALEMLTTLRQRIDQGLGPKQVAYEFQTSENFHRALCDAAGGQASDR